MAYNFVYLLRKNGVLNKLSVMRLSSHVKDKPKSSLFISGKRAVDTFVVVIPHLDFNQRFANLSQLEENIKRRKLDVNVAEMKESWEFYKDWNEKKSQLQENLSVLKKQFTTASKTKDSEEKKLELEKLQLHTDLIKEDLDQVKKNVWDIQDNVIAKLLTLPNTIHPETPDEEVEIFVFDKEDVNEGFDHLSVGEKLDYVQYSNEIICFLKNEAALFELAVPELFINEFGKQGFVRFCNPDFARSVLVEGIGLTPHETSEIFLLENTEGNNDNLHLCGGASLFPFCGYHAKHTVAKKYLPVRYVAAGRRYTPSTTSLPGLYSVIQSTSVQVFTATFNDEEMYRELQVCVETLKDVLSALGLNFRVVKQPPPSLKRWESLRVSFQVFSPYQNVYVEVGHVCIVDDYISKRLRMYYTDKKDDFLKVVSGTVVNVQTLLALCLERSVNELFIPNVVKDYMMV